MLTLDDPRTDLHADSPAWSQLLERAYGIDGGEYAGLYGTLHGIRCLGAHLTVTAAGARLEPGELGDAYEEIRARWLVPHAQRLTQLLAGLPVEVRS